MVYLSRVILWAVASTLILFGSNAARADESAASAKLPVEEVERIVREYLLREPEIIYEAIQELQRRREMAESERQKDMIVLRKQALFEDPSDPVAGNVKGDVTLVEFFDYRCGYCRNMMPGLNALIDQDDKLRFVFKEFPILGPESVIAARAAMAADRQGRYRDMHMALMQSSDLSQEGVMAIAERLGLDLEQLEKDMASEEIAEKLEANKALAAELGINGTPSFIVGDQLIGGAAPVADLAKLIGDERNAVN